MCNVDRMKDYIKDEYRVGVHFRPTPRSGVPNFVTLIIISWHLFLNLLELLSV